MQRRWTRRHPEQGVLLPQRPQHASSASYPRRVLPHARQVAEEEECNTLHFASRVSQMPTAYWPSPAYLCPGVLPPDCHMRVRHPCLHGPALPPATLSVDTDGGFGSLCPNGSMAPSCLQATMQSGHLPLCVSVMAPPWSWTVHIFGPSKRPGHHSFPLAALRAASSCSSQAFAAVTQTSPHWRMSGTPALAMQARLWRTPGPQHILHRSSSTIPHPSLPCPSGCRAFITPVQAAGSLCQTNRPSAATWARACSVPALVLETVEPQPLQPLTTHTPQVLAPTMPCWRCYLAGLGVRLAALQQVVCSPTP